MGTTERSRRGRLFAVVAALLVAAATARAGAPSGDIDRPFVFPAAEVNTVVMPYEFAGGSELGGGGTGNELSLLVHFDTLFSMMKYRSIGGVRLVSDPDRTDVPDADTVGAMLLGREPGALDEVAPGHAMVLVWGRIYEEDEHIFVQSYLRSARRERQEDVPVAVLGQDFAGWLPAQGVAFPPRELTRRQLEEIRDAFSESALLRPRRDENLPGLPLPLDVGRDTSFWITDARDGWLEITGQQGEFGGWVLASTDLGEQPLQQVMPELVFVDGIVGYLSARVRAEQGDREGSARSAQAGLEAMEAYRKLEGEGKGAAAEAVARSWAVSGCLELLADGGFKGAGEKAWTKAEEHFSRAAALTPYDAALANLELTAVVRNGYLAPSPDGRDAELEERMLRVTGLDPGNERLLGNLESLYALLLQEGPPPGTEDETMLDDRELSEKLEFVKGLR